jgi:hypothetical protein
MTRNCTVFGNRTATYILHKTATFAHDRAVARREKLKMTDVEYTRMLDELDRLLNDPDVPIEPARVWSLLAELSLRDMVSGAQGNTAF